MAKKPEEGLIWEWRAFGRTGEGLLSRIVSHPVRMGIVGHSGVDLYLVSPASEHNIKLRKWDRGWLLKFKLLLDKSPDLIELYSESARQVYRFPIDPKRLTKAASLLNTTLRKKPSAPELTRKQFLKALESASPAISTVEVAKVRSQFECEEGWIELAEVDFPKRKVSSVSVHASSLEAVQRIVEQIDPGPKLKVMNYLEACKRWR
ncbi:MAG TPA: hypothetical protein VE262_03290 [Blastocatellia bacterium]|nr:hypothetical protein [Blastocatellia bacterium]